MARAKEDDGKKKPRNLKQGGAFKNLLRGDTMAGIFVIARKQKMDRLYTTAKILRNTNIWHTSYHLPFSPAIAGDEAVPMMVQNPRTTPRYIPLKTESRLVRILKKQQSTGSLFFLNFGACAVVGCERKVNKMRRTYQKRYQKLTPYGHGTVGTGKRIKSAKQTADYEREAKERGIPVSRVIAEKIQ